MVSDPGWVAKHLQTIHHSLRKAPRYSSYLEPRLKEWYAAVAEEPNLSRLNRALIEAVMCELGIKTPLHSSADLPQEGDRTGRLVSICRALGATHYLSGQSARDYMDMDQMSAAGIEVRWMDYPDYPAYKQMNGAYEPGISIIDVLAHLPPENVF